MQNNSKQLYWHEEIDIITKDFVDRFGGRSFGELNWKPNPQTWSIAQNIDHLIRVNETYYPIVAQIRNGNYKLPFTAKFSFTTRFFEKFILNAV